MTGVSDEVYDVALSYAGEQLDYVKKVAASLRRRRVRVFFAKNEIVKMWGENLVVFLQQVFEKGCRYCVMFSSREYKRKFYPTVERESALSDAVKFMEKRILPVRFDDTELPGLPGATCYVKTVDYEPSQLAKLISEKIKLNVEETRKTILNNSEEMLKSTNIVDWENGIGLILRLLSESTRSTRSPDPDPFKVSDDLMHLDSSAREVFKILLNKCLDNNNYSIASVVLDGIDKYQPILGKAQKEALFSNWMDFFREIYNEKLRSILEEFMERKSKIYDTDAYNFFVHFGRTLIEPMLHSVGIEKELYTCFVGVGIIKEIAFDGIAGENEFHTATHDNITTLPFSSFLEPLLYQLSRLVLKFSKGTYDDSDLWYVTKGIAEFIFAALMKMRDRGLFTDCSRIGSGWLFQNPLFIHAFIECKYLQRLFECDSPERFDYILDPIIQAVKDKSNEMKFNQIERLADFALATWPAQKQIYQRIADALTRLCLACIGVMDDSKKFRYARELARLLVSGKKDMHYIHDLTIGVKALASSIEYGDFDNNLKEFQQYIGLLREHANDVKASLVSDATYKQNTNVDDVFKSIEPGEWDIETAKICLEFWPSQKDEYHISD